MRINKSIDIEEEIRTALAPYLTTYCRPLPKDYTLPNILITQVGGTTVKTVDTFSVVIDSRADSEAEALDTLNTAIGIIKQVAKEQTTAMRHVTINTSGSWGNDPVRPDLSMCSARIDVVAHQTTMEVIEA
ncbi:MAG: hypothetical protein J6E40_06580 [Lachnospiraceae bacterium]|nr:hypothetical protein [Lachnospiraceae bacterium]